MRVRNSSEVRRLYPSLHLELDPGEEARIGQADDLPDHLERVDEPRSNDKKKTTTPAKPADDEENA